MINKGQVIFIEPGERVIISLQPDLDPSDINNMPEKAQKDLAGTACALHKKNPSKDTGVWYLQTPRQ